MIDLQGAPECVRCFRSDPEHDLARRDEADDIQRRIWKALGWPCSEFTQTLARVFAGQQARTSRWAPQRRPEPSPALAPTASGPPATAVTGAAAARAALDEVLNRRRAS